MLNDISAWTEAWRSATEEMGRVSDTAYWDRRAEDYDDFIRTSEFAYGEAMAGLLAEAGCLPRGARVLEIASGVGAVTLPLARLAAQLTAFEPAPGMAERLAANAAAAGQHNIAIRREPFTAETAVEPAGCDLALMCHAAWQFPDLLGLVSAMERASRGFCCLADTVGRTDAATAAMHQTLGLPLAAAEDRTPYLFNLLYLSGRLPRLAYVPWTMRRSRASAVATVAHGSGQVPRARRRGPRGHRQTRGRTQPRRRVRKPLGHGRVVVAGAGDARDDAGRLTASGLGAGVKALKDKGVKLAVQPFFSASARRKGSPDPRAGMQSPGRHDRSGTSPRQDIPLGAARSPTA